MKIVSFNFRKVSIEKLSDSFEDVKINSKINISEIKMVNTTSSNEKEGLLSVLFSYNIDYAPNVAHIDLEGKIILLGDKKEIREIDEKWKDRKMTEEFRVNLFNIILRKVNVKALELEEEMKLPLHIPMPALKVPKEDNS